MLHALAKAGVTLKDSKGVFSVQHLTFLGHWLNEDGVRSDEKKVEAIMKRKSPKNRIELQRLLERATYLARSFPISLIFLSHSHSCCQKSKNLLGVLHKSRHSTGGSRCSHLVLSLESSTHKKKQSSPPTHHSSDHRHQLTVENDLLLYAVRVVFHDLGRKEILGLLHE